MGSLVNTAGSVLVSLKPTEQSIIMTHRLGSMGKQPWSCWGVRLPLWNVHLVFKSKICSFSCSLQNYFCNVIHGKLQYNVKRLCRFTQILLPQCAHITHKSQEGLYIGHTSYMLIHSPTPAVHDFYSWMKYSNVINFHFLPVGQTLLICFSILCFFFFAMDLYFARLLDFCFT